jgi:hypothetical protein
MWIMAVLKTAQQKLDEMQQRRRQAARERDYDLEQKLAAEIYLYWMEVIQGMSRFLLNIAKRTLPRLTLRGVGLASKNAVG